MPIASIRRRPTGRRESSAIRSSRSTVTTPAGTTPNTCGASDFAMPSRGKPWCSSPISSVCRPRPSALYKSRWQVELFFKWIKQHLRIKQFFGTSENAVKTQIWIAVSIYVLVAIVKKRLKLEASLYTLLQILSVTLFEKLPLDQALTHDADKGVTPQITNQLDLFAY